MQKFSSSYGGTKENFIVKTFSPNTSKVDENINAVLCTVQNILQRGNPTKPSDFLVSKFGELDAPPVYLIDDSKIIWRNIKGDDENSYYPAKNFYDRILPEILGEYLFVKNLILPEAEFSDVLTKTAAFNGQATDFYCPQLKVAIEIDGGSHDEFSQRQKDNLRDAALKAEGVEVFRIKTADLESKSKIFNLIMQRLKNKVLQSDLIQEYKAALQVKAATNLKYDSVMRLQMALLHCFKNGVIDLKNSKLNINIVNSDVDKLDELLKIAYEDLSQWILNVAQLAKIKIELPALKISDGKNSVTLDFSMFRRYADGDKNFNTKKTTIYIRTDYFFDKDYFQVAAAKKIRYKFTAAEELNDDKSLKFLLKNIFGYSEFRLGQMPILKHILNCNDTIGILPTGTGKSLCYQLAALLQPGVALVIVPIISLMEDQKRVMNLKGITRADFISSNVTGAAREKITNDFKRGKFQFMVVSPERLQNAEFRESLGEINRTLKFSLAVIDEVHCLSEWGHDFRISYLRLIPTIRQYCPQANLLGLTATASQAVLNDLKAEFDDDGSGIKALQSMDREELIFHRITVKSDAERDAKIFEIIKENDGTYEAGGKIKNSVGLIFCQTVKTKNGCEKLQARLLAANVLETGNIELFHGQLKPEIKSQNQARFMEKNFAGLMVCTTAFGMGIDKENIKYTIHNSLPKSIEAFYQEAGRAGRDAVKLPKSNCYIVQKPETAPASIINKIFDRNTSIVERQELSRRLYSDLSTVMYFLNLDRDAPEIECNKILDVLKEVIDAPTVDGRKKINFDSDSSLKGRQMSLYKLTILGIVKDWTVEYFNLSRGTLSVDYVGIEVENVKISLLKYIRKHDAEFSLDGKLTDYKTYYDLLEKFSAKPIRAFLMILIVWTNNTILYNRLQSSKNMLDFSAPEVTDAEFRRKINEFFKYTEQTVIFDSIVEEPRNFQNWFEILTFEDDGTTQVISADKAQSISNSLRRYLESYANNTGLNYLSGMLGLICGNFEGLEGAGRLYDSFRNIKESFEPYAQEKIIEMTLQIVYHCAENEQNLFSETFLKIYPEFAARVHEVLKDFYSLSFIVDVQTFKIKNLLEANTVGLFKTA